jgi:hypothetical protein
MAYGLKYYFVDKKLVGTTDTTYTFEILEDGYSGSTTEWVGVDIRRQFEELSFRRIQNIQKSSCGGVVRVVDATQRSAIETIAGSEIGDYKVQLKRDGTVIWIGLVVPDLISIGEQNYGNQSAEIIAKDLFFTGNFPLTTLIPDTRGIEKAIVLMADILDTLGYGLDIVSYTSWIENNLTQSDDILNQSYHEKERFRIYGESEGEDDRPLTNQQALEYILKSYGLILRQVNGAWNLVQITAFSNPASVRRYVYNSSGTQTSSSTSYSLGSSAVSDELYVLGSSGNNYFAGVKVARSKFEHDSIIQGIKFNREYWIDDASEISKSQYWQADGTGNLELSFTTWFAKTTDTDLGNPVVMTVSIYVDTGGTDYYWNGTSWVTSPATIDVEVQETYSTTDSDGNYLYKNTGISIVTDPIPDPADGTLYVKLTPDALQPNYAYWYLRDLVFDLKYSDTVEGISSAILYELEQTGNYSDDYDYGTYYFGDGPTSASLSALKDSSRALLSQWKRAGDVSTTNHQNLVLNEILNVRRNQRRNIRATLYGEYEPDDILSYDSASFFFLGGSWSSQAYQWRCNFIELNVEEDTDTLTAFYITDGSGTSSGAVGSTGGSTGTSSLYLEKGKNLSDVPTPATARTNLGLGTGDSPTFSRVVLSNQADDGTKAVRADRNVSAGDGVTGGGDLTADRTLTLGTPSTTTVGGSNAVTTGSHTHALDLSGRSITLSDDSDGVITFDTNTQDLGADRTFTPTIADHANGQRGVLSVNAQTIYGAKSFNDNIFPLADVETTDFSSWFSASPTGWQISQAGVGDFRTLYIDELVAKAFTADVAQALAGTDILTKSVAKLNASFVVPAVSGTVTITIEDLEGLSGLQVFEAGDHVRARVVDSTSGLDILDVYGTVSNYSDNSDGTQEWDYTITYAGASNLAVGQTVNKGNVLLDYGTSGDYYIERTVLDRSSGTDFSKVPYNRIVQWTNTVSGSPRAGDPNTNISVITQSGNLANLTSTYSNVSGFGFFGENTFLTGSLLVGDLSKAGNYLEYNGTDLNIVTNTFNLDTTNLDISSANENIVIGTGSALMTVGKLSSVEQGIKINSNGITNQNYWKLGQGDVQFKVGDGTNFLSFNENAGTFEIETQAFRLDTTASGGGIDIDSTTQTIKLEDSNKVRTQVDITNGSNSVSVDVNQSISAQTITDLSAYETLAGTYYNVDLGDAVEVFVNASLTTLTNADGATFNIALYGGNSSTSATNLLAQKRSQIISSGSTSLYLTAYSYTYDYFKVRIEADIDNPGEAPPTPAVTFTTSTFTVKSYESQTRIALDGVYVNNDSTQYARLTRDSNKLSGLTILENLPTGDPEIAGAIYNDSGTLKISAG